MNIGDLFRVKSLILARRGEGQGPRRTRRRSLNWTGEESGERRGRRGGCQRMPSFFLWVFHWSPSLDWLSISVSKAFMHPLIQLRNTHRIHSVLQWTDSLTTTQYDTFAHNSKRLILRSVFLSDDLSQVRLYSAAQKCTTHSVARSILFFVVLRFTEPV